MAKEICPSCGSPADFTMLKGEKGLGIAQLYMCSECGDEITRCTVCGKPMKWGLQCVKCTAKTVERITNPLVNIVPKILKK